MEVLGVILWKNIQKAKKSLLAFTCSKNEKLLNEREYYVYEQLRLAQQQ